jgi:CRP/FNR family transcriptional regulator, cyclic AMP receptor protein
MSIEALVQVIQTLNADDALRLGFGKDDWHLLEACLQRHQLRSGDLLIRHRDMDRALYLLESGTLQVYVPETAPVRRPVAILRPGSVIGEPSLFGDTPRMAQVEAMSPAVVWALTRNRFEEFAARQPALALELLRACGAVMAERMRANLERGLPLA